MTKEEMIEFRESLDDWVYGSIAAFEALTMYRTLSAQEQEDFYKLLKPR